MGWKAITCGALFMLLTASSATVSAAPITGDLNITGAATVSAAEIDWFPTDGGEGVFDITFPGTGYFVDIWKPFSGVNTGVSLDLPAGPFPVDDFLSEFDTPFAEYDDLSFTLEGFVIPVVPVCGTPDGSGVAGDQDGETCVVFAGSPFALTMGANLSSTDVKFNVFGSFVDLSFGDDGSLNDATGLYTANIANLTPLQIQALILGGGSIDSSYSAQFHAVATVAEPATLSLLTLGATAAGYRRRRRNAR